MESQFGLFNNLQLRNEFLAKTKQRALKALDLPLSDNPGRRFEKVVITIPDFELKSTPDNHQTREFLGDRMITGLREHVRSKQITRLASQGVRVELGRWGPELQYQLIASVWY